MRLGFALKRWINALKLLMLSVLSCKLGAVIPALPSPRESKEAIDQKVPRPWVTTNEYTGEINNLLHLISPFSVLFHKLPVKLSDMCKVTDSQLVVKSEQMRKLTLIEHLVIPAGTLVLTPLPSLPL